MNQDWDLRKLFRAMDAARKIRFAIFDVDGVLFEARVNQGGGPIEKVRSYNDGQGISWLRDLDIKIAFITNEKGDHAKPVRDTVAKWNALASSKSESNPAGWEPIVLFEGSGGRKKVGAAEEFVCGAGGKLSEASFMGDDVVDAALMQLVGFPVVPAQAERVVVDLALWRTPRAGGHGAIRDFADFIIASRDVNPLDLKFS